MKGGWCVIVYYVVKHLRVVDELVS